mmetsp:Transcript_47465/g.88822  ORF Transcript_47465/g.88822 Transcript_47465/m.88822 type:complete len:203 (-) Transcript_47465:96-704(-)
MDSSRDPLGRPGATGPRCPALEGQATTGQWAVPRATRATHLTVGQAATPLKDLRAMEVLRSQALVARDPMALRRCHRGGSRSQTRTAVGLTTAIAPQMRHVGIRPPPPLRQLRDCLLVGSRSPTQPAADPTSATDQQDRPAGSHRMGPRLRPRPRPLPLPPRRLQAQVPGYRRVGSKHRIRIVGSPTSSTGLQVRPGGSLHS